MTIEPRITKVLNQVKALTMPDRAMLVAQMLDEGIISATQLTAAIELKGQAAGKPARDSKYVTGDH